MGKVRRLRAIDRGEKLVIADRNPTDSTKQQITMKPLYIFDIDGTMALIDHRRDILKSDDPNRWRRFYAACDEDLPNVPVIATMEALRLSGADIWFFSGRSEEVRRKTITWLVIHTSFQPWDFENILSMRAEMDYTADDILKKQWLDSMLVDDRNRLVAAFDDRDRVVAMWRAAGVPCFQVAPGEF